MKRNQIVSKCYIIAALMLRQNSIIHIILPKENFGGNQLLVWFD